MLTFSKRLLNAYCSFVLIGSAAGNFDIVIHNQIFKKAYHELRDFILKELEAQYNEGINVCLDRVPLSETDHNHD